LKEYRLLKVESMKKTVHLFSIFLLVLLSMQCKPLYLEEAPQPVSLSALPTRQWTSRKTPPKAENLSRDLMVLENGDNLGKMLLRTLPSRELANELVSLVASEMDLRRMQAGQEVILFRNEEDELKKMQLPNSERIVELEKKGDSWTIRSKQRNLHSLIRFKTGVVDSNLYNAAVDAEIPLAVLMEMIQLFSFEVDFQRDIYHNDYFQVAYEEILDEENQVIDTGRVIFAHLYSNGQTRTYEMYRYTDLEGSSDYYDSEGKSIRRELLKTPINGAYISSGYGMRVSPFLGYSKMHKGVDFAAAQGTPIYAAGSGTVIVAGWSDVYGWYIKIRHANHYETLYAHMVSFKSGVRRGVRIEQGSIIGYVGSTGMSTGPHCHYEVLYYGGHVNPSTVKFPPGKTLSGTDLELFKKRRETYISAFL